MKQILSLLIFSMLLSTFAFGQKPEQRDRIKSLKIAFLTEKLQLTPEESEKFWPIYNEMESKMKALDEAHKTMRKGGGEVNTDEEAEQMVNKSFEMQEKQLALKKKYFERLKTVIPVKKVAMLGKAERQFREQIVEEMKRRKMGRRDGGHPGRKK